MKGERKYDYTKASLPLLPYPKLPSYTPNTSKNQETMASKIPISTSASTASLATELHIPPKPSSFRSICPPRTHPIRHFKRQAKLGGEDGEVSKDAKKKFITKEEEPDQYWQTAGEREGKNPMMTPLPYIIIFGMSTPFIILAIGFLNGWIKVPVR